MKCEFKKNVFATVKKLYGPDAHPYKWQDGDPPILEFVNHLGLHVLVIRNPNKHKLHPLVIKHLGGMLTEDPGGDAFKTNVSGVGDIFILGFSLSDFISYKNKMMRRFTKTRDTMINKLIDLYSSDESAFNILLLESLVHFDNTTSDILGAKIVSLHAKKVVLDKAVLARNGLATDLRRAAFKDMQRAKSDFDAELNGLRQECNLTRKIEDAQEKINHEVKKVHDVTTFFESCWEFVLSPDFKADQGMLKKKPVGGLSKYWKSKISTMAHARSRKLLERRISRKGGVLVDPSEAWSTYMCGSCLTLHHPGMFHYIFLLL